MHPWLRLDDGFPEHPKVVGLSDAAFRLEVTAICYAHRAMTDGHITTAWPGPRLARAVGELEAARLWVPTEEGWVLNGYLEWQTSRRAIEEIRKRQSEGGKKGAAKRWGTQ